MADEQTYRWRISKRVYFFLTGSGIWAGETYSTRRPELNEPARSLREKIDGAPQRKDGSRHVKLTAAEATILVEHVEAMIEGARDNASLDDPDSTADLNAARALLRQEYKLPDDAVWKVGSPN